MYPPGGTCIEQPIVCLTRQLLEYGLQRIVPVRHPPAKSSLQLGAVEPGVHRSLRRRRILSRGDRLYRSQLRLRLKLLQFGNSLHGEAVPRRLSRAAGVIDAAHRARSLMERAFGPRGGSFHLLNRMGGQPRQVETPRGRAVLVGNDPQMLAFARQPQNRKQEVLPRSPVNPARPELKAGDAAGGHSRLARQLAPAVDVQRVGRVRFSVRRLFCAIENVIGRIVDHRRAKVFSLCREQLRAGRVDREGQVRLLLRLVHRGMRSGIHHPARPKFTHHLANRLWFGKVEDIECRSKQFAQRRQSLFQRIPHLAAVARNQNSSAHRLLRHQYTLSSITRFRYSPYVLFSILAASAWSCDPSMNPCRYAISSRQATFSPWRFSMVWMKSDASSSESCVPVSSHAIPRPSSSVVNCPRSRYQRLTSVISNSPLGDGRIDSATPTIWSS